MSTPAPQVNGNGEASITAAPQQHQTTSTIQPNDVGWQFVPQYYNFVNKQPDRLHCFYNKRSTFIHGEEGEESQVALGQQEIHSRISAIGYKQCKVYIHSIDSQSSANGGIIILVIGEMSNNNGPWRKFTQTFFLAEQPNGYFVLNDIFRYLKEDIDDEDLEEQAEEAHPPAPADAAAVEVAPAAAATAPEPVAEQPVEESAPEEPAAEPTPEPEPVSAPAEVDQDAVPEEAQVASVPDKDVAPSESSAAVEEPTTSTPPPASEQAPTPKPASPVPAPAAPAAPKANGNAAPAPSPAPPAAPAQPAAPPKPKTWASLAASGSAAKTWGSALVNQPASSTPAPAAAPAAKKEEAPASSAPASGDARHPFYVNATKVSTAHCFVKLPNWSADNQAGGETISENDLRNIASRFGEVKKVEIVKQKACAFVEYVRVESARKAIIASLPVAQGGEDGVKSGEAKLHFETRKEKDERRKNGPVQGQGRGGAPDAATRGPRAAGPGAGGQQGQGPERGAGAQRGRGRGRGGQGNQGDRAPQQAASK